MLFIVFTILHVYCMEEAAACKKQIFAYVLLI